MAFLLLQAGTAAILFTGGNTSFTGFPFLASFVAADSFLPRWLTRRGQRLVFSNGVIVLTAMSLTLLLVAGATVPALIPFYAIGVFTGFSMAGFGMARYHRRTREPGWRRRLVISTVGGIYTALVVVVFAIVKFTEGAWLIVILFPALVYLLIRLNREYRLESAALDGYDMAVAAAVRYARSQRPRRRRTRRQRGRGRGHLRNRRAAAAELPAPRRPGAARPHRRHDRPAGQPRPRRGRHHHSLRRPPPRQPPRRDTRARPPRRAPRRDTEARPPRKPRNPLVERERDHRERGGSSRAERGA